MRTEAQIREAADALEYGTQFMRDPEAIATVQIEVAALRWALGESQAAYEKNLAEEVVLARVSRAARNG